jgi:hypothetical protein
MPAAGQIEHPFQLPSSAGTIPASSIALDDVDAQANATRRR